MRVVLLTIPHTVGHCRQRSIAGVTQRPRPPLALVVACLVVAVEALALIVLALRLVIGVISGAAELTGPTLVMALMFAALAALQLAGAWALFRGRRWGRGPVITWQLLLIAIGISQAVVLPVWATVLCIVLPLVAITGVLLPAATAWTVDAGSQRG